MSTGYSFRASVIGTLIRTKRPDVPLRVALRNTAAVILPLALGLMWGYPQVGIGIAAGALDTMFSDQPGPYQQRLSRLFLAALAAGAASLVGFSIGNLVLPMSVACAICGFFGGLLVVFGPDIARVGMTSMLLLDHRRHAHQPRRRTRGWRADLCRRHVAGGVLHCGMAAATLPAGTHGARHRLSWPGRPGAQAAP